MLASLAEKQKLKHLIVLIAYEDGKGVGKPILGSIYFFLRIGPLVSLSKTGWTSHFLFCFHFHIFVIANPRFFLPFRGKPFCEGISVKTQSTQKCFGGFDSQPPSPVLRNLFVCFSCFFFPHSIQFFFLKINRQSNGRKDRRHCWRPTWIFGLQDETFSVHLKSTIGACFSVLIKGRLFYSR